jgi:hypothetical protein
MSDRLFRIAVLGSELFLLRFWCSPFSRHKMTEIGRLALYRLSGV